MNNPELIEAFEATGLSYDPGGPDPTDCQYCGGPLQFIADHDCYGIRGESREASFGGFGVIEE